MLYLFDLDNTLISGYMDRPDKNFDAWHVLPGRRARLNQLVMQGHKVAIITNQGAVAFGLVSERACSAKLNEAIRMLGLTNPRSSGDAPDPLVYCAIHHPKGRPPYNDPELAARRKPSGAMIREAILDYPHAAASGVLMIGDRPEDEAAANDAGVPFQWSSEFFADKDEPYAHL
jgi:D-glycero-D-manno-heptose 1,7-bisphosphate phosphatase